VVQLRNVPFCYYANSCHKIQTDNSVYVISGLEGYFPVRYFLKIIKVGFLLKINVL